MSDSVFINELKGHKYPLPMNICIVVNTLYYLKPFAKVIVAAEPLDNIGSDIERASFNSLKHIISSLETTTKDPINLHPFLDKFCHVTTTSLHEFEGLDVSFIWDSVIKLITVVIPPLREVFVGRISDSSDIPGWLNLISRCFHAQFLHNSTSLEDVIKSTLQDYDFDEDDEDDYDDDDEDSEMYDSRSPDERIRNFNARILFRAPEILVFAVESSHLPLALRFTDMFTKSVTKTKPPNAIRFPESFDVSTFVNDALISKNLIPNEFEPFSPNWYDLTGIVSLEGNSFDSVHAYYRELGDEAATNSNSSSSSIDNDVHGSHSCKWFHGTGQLCEEVARSKAVDGNFFSSSSSKRTHPRMLIYVKRGIFTVLDRLQQFVTKSGQMRSLGDDTFDSAQTPEHYDEARHYYDGAIAFDPDLRNVLKDRLAELEQIERNQRARCYETQADLSLGRRRFKEACDLYKNALRSASSGTVLFQRLREKEEYMMKIISLEIANHLTEKGQECVRAGLLVQGKEHFMQALKLNPSYIHLQTIISGIEQAITVQSSAQKVAEANQAMKVGKYKLANQLFRESISLVPERAASLNSVLDSLVGLMQGEDALIKQRLGLVALEDKKYPLAIDYITDAIKLLPPESSTEHAFFLCDRAQVYFEMKDYTTSIDDCNAALALKIDLAMAYLRLGAAQFELERYDEASESYDRAIRNDPSLADQVKVKVRQVNTAKEILQRKEREAERARVKEEERRKLEERRAREELAKKQRQLKLEQEKQEKVERNLMRAEELLTRKLLDASGEALASTTKGSAGVAVSGGGKDTKLAGKEKAKKEKAARDLLKQQERERVKAEKEKERERVKLAKEQKQQDERRAKQEELQKQQDFAAELERAQQRQRDAEKEKELEREKARQERERLIAEREKAREEKLAEAKKNKAEVKRTAPTSTSSGGANTGSNEVNTGSSLSISSGSNAETFPSIFGNAKVTIKGSNKNIAIGADALVTSNPTAATTAAGAGTSGTKWSSILTPVAASVLPPPPPPPPPPHATGASPVFSSVHPPGVGANYATSLSGQSRHVNHEFPPLGEVPPPASSSASASGSAGMKDGGNYQYVPGASGSWAAYERATMEAAAERTFTGESSGQARAGTGVEDNKRNTNFSTISSEVNLSPLMSSLGVSSVERDDTKNNSNIVDSIGHSNNMNYNSGTGGTSSGSLIQSSSAAKLATENEDSDINMLLNSSLEPLSPGGVTPSSVVAQNTGSAGGLDLGPLSFDPTQLQGSTNISIGGGLDTNSHGMLGNSLGLHPGGDGIGFGDLNHSLNVPLGSGLHDPSQSIQSSSKLSLDNYSSLLGNAGSSNPPPVTAGNGHQDRAAGDDDLFRLLGGSAYASTTGNSLLGSIGGVQRATTSGALGGLDAISSSSFSLLGDGTSLGGAPPVTQHNSHHHDIGMTSSFLARSVSDSTSSSSVGHSGGGSLYQFGASAAGSLDLGVLNSSTSASSSTGQTQQLQRSPPPLSSNHQLYQNHGNVQALSSLGVGGVGMDAVGSSSILNGFNLPSASHVNAAATAASSSRSPPPPDLTLSPSSTATLTMMGTGGGSTSAGINASSSTFLASPLDMMLHRQAPPTPPPALTLSPSMATNVAAEASINNSTTSGTSSHLAALVASLEPSNNASSMAQQQQQQQLASTMAATVAGKGMEYDILPESEFPMVAWLRSYQMHMYRWAGNAKEWTEFAMHIPVHQLGALFQTDGSPLPVLTEISRRSGCNIWDEVEVLQGTREKFLVFSKGASNGQNMLAALELLSTHMRDWLAPKLSTSIAGAAGTTAAAGAPTTGATTHSFLGAVVQQKQTPLHSLSTSSLNSMISSNPPSSSSTTTADIAGLAGAGSATTGNPTTTHGGGSLGQMQGNDSLGDAAAAAAAATVLGMAWPADLAAAAADQNILKRDRPALLKVVPLPGSGYVQRYLEIPREVVGLIIGQGGKKIKELCAESGAKIQFRVNKTAEREGRPGLLEVNGSMDNVDKALQLIWDLLQMLGKEYNEVAHNTNNLSIKSK